MIHFIEFKKLKGLITWISDAIEPFPINSIQELFNLAIQEIRKHTILLLLKKQLIVCRGVLSSLNKNHLTFFMMSPYFNTLPLHKIILRIKIKVCSEKFFRESSYRIKNSQLKSKLSKNLQRLKFWKVVAFPKISIQMKKCWNKLWGPNSEPPLGN